MVRVLVRSVGRMDRHAEDGQGDGDGGWRRREFAFRGGNGGGDVRAQEMRFGGGKHTRRVEALDARAQRGEAGEHGCSVFALRAGTHRGEHALQRARVGGIEMPRTLRVLSSNPSNAHPVWKIETKFSG